MEKPRNTGKRDKPKMALGIGGGGGVVGGVVVCGGVMAIATLVAVSAIRLRRKRPPANESHHPPPTIPSTDVPNKLELNNNNDDEGKGLDFLQDSSPPVDYQPRDGITDMSANQIDSTSLDFTRSLILDDNPVVDTSGQYEKPTHLDSVLCDNSKPKSSSLVIDYGVNVQQCSLPVFDIPSLLKPGNVNKNESTEGRLDGEVTEVMAESKAIKAPYADQFEEEEEEPPQMQFIGEEREAAAEEHDDGETILETGEDVIETAQANQFVADGLEVTEVMRENKAVEDQGHMKSIEKEQEYGHAETTVEKGEETTQKNQFVLEVDLEAIEVMKEDEAIAAPDAPQTEAEDNPQVQLIAEEQESDDGGSTVEKEEEAVETVEGNSQVALSEEEDNDDNNVHKDKEEIGGKSEESSEGTRDSSMESNAEAIWPVESIEEIEKKIDEYTTVQTGEHGSHDNVKHGNIYANGHHNNEDTGKSIITSSNIKQRLMRIDNVSTDSSNLRIWIWATSVLLVVVVVVLAAAHSLVP